MNSKDLDVEFSWCDSNSFIKLPDQEELVLAGTCLKINDYILFLNTLSLEQLGYLRLATEDSIKCELAKRGIS